MRTVVSVSMEPEMATRLKNSAAEKGQSFSARVCELLESGEAFERMDCGLFASTSSDDGPPFSVEDGEKSGVGGSPANEVPAPESSLPAGSPDVIESGNEDQPDSRREELLHDPVASVSGPEDVPIRGGNKATPAAEIGQDADHAEQVLPTGTVEERVYGCVSAEKNSVKSIAERVGISEVEAGEVLERLIDKDNEPIVLKPIAGEWSCWLAA